MFSDFFDPIEYIPEDARSFFISLRLSIGRAGGERGVDNFDLNICTPSWLMRMGGDQWGRFLLIVDSYDYSRIVRLIEDYIDGCDGDSWGELALKLSRMFQWEFEDYKG